MSADNGIYIGRFPQENEQDQFEYRVIETSAIDNIIDPNSMDFIAKEVVKYFSPSPIFLTKGEAFEYADKLLSETEICEYGISNIYFEMSFNYYVRCTLDLE